MKTSFRMFCLTCLALMGLTARSHADDLLVENFEGLPMQPYTSPTETPFGDGTDWSDKLPAGWNMTFTGPVGNPIEFQGWRVHDVDSWIKTEGNQDRGTWTRGGVDKHGSVLVVDPDAYDDGTDIGPTHMDTSVTTRPIALSGVAANTIHLAVDSFIKNEEPSDLSIDVSYDGGVNYSNLLFYESDNLAANQILDEHLDLPVNNPNSGSLVFKFSLLRGDNDWWWALDNVAVTGRMVPEPSSLVLFVGSALGLLGRARRRDA